MSDRLSLLRAIAEHDGSYPRLAIGCPSAKRRPCLIGQSLLSLRAEGFRETVRVWLEPEADDLDWASYDVEAYRNHEKLGLRDNFCHVVESIADDPRDASHALLLQDDVIFLPGSRERILQQAFRRPGTLASAWTASRMAEKSAGAGWRPLPRKKLHARGFLGALALLVPVEYLRKLSERIQRWAKPMGGIDTNFGVFAFEQRLPLFVHQPTLVLHAGHYSAKGPCDAGRPQVQPCTEPVLDWDEPGDICYEEAQDA
jgi:hypothetical protein